MEKSTWDKERAVELYNTGYCDQQIADILGTTYHTVRGWRRKVGLVGHRKTYVVAEKKTDVPSLAELAAEARKHGMTYGQYMVARREGKV